MNLKSLIVDFLDLVDKGEVEIYNEFSLQHELGIFLREKLEGYKVEFERNANNYFKIPNTTKHEIDIVVYNDNQTEKYAIELKYPRNRQYPEQMFSFVKDIKFMEELKEAGFEETYCLTIVEQKQKGFYSGNKERIYEYFRGSKLINGEIRKPTGKKDELLDIKGKYSIEWKDCNDLKFYIVEL